ncbi:MAG: MtrB/PioB family outer membrane beta-barrel protein, partial [Elusimicrobia bacterium]|nr:MtrB/PioB family outer membrane beta-barrel protein [Elusimicrobiota bacterium]
VSVRADWDPLDYLNVGLDYGLIRDDFKADYGALDGKTHYYSVDFSVNPSQWWSFYSDYTWEQMTLNTRSRYRATGVDLEANDWSGYLQDTVHTFDVGTQCDLIQDKMDVRLDWNLSYAKGVQQATNPNTITTASAAAIDLPDTYNRLSRIRAALRYRWLKNLTARLSYEFQHYRETDWSQDDLQVYQSVWNKSVFLGATQSNFDAHLVALGLSYAF